MRVVLIPTLMDNYTYLIVCEKTSEAAIVDSPDAKATWGVIKKENVKPAAIFSTHHHWDHVGGNEELLQYQKMDVYGSLYDQNRVPGLTKTLKEGDQVKIGSLTFSILEIPGHTLGHIAFYGHGALFCGDTLFASGCGRLFEGSAQQMVSSLTKLKKLPEDTKIYCGHEYTQKNMEFALTLEPSNPALQKKYQEVVNLRKNNQPTIPTTMAEEKSYNPFLRWESLEIMNRVGKKDPIDVFSAVRRMKDNY